MANLLTALAPAGMLPRAPTGPRRRFIRFGNPPPSPPAVDNTRLSTRQHESWHPNADAWIDAVRSGSIGSRRRGTDAAVVAACAAQPGLRVLDVGCGEGWLARALAAQGFKSE